MQPNADESHSTIINQRSKSAKKLFTGKCIFFNLEEKQVRKLEESGFKLLLHREGYYTSGKKKIFRKNGKYFFDFRKEKEKVTKRKRKDFIITPPKGGFMNYLFLVEVKSEVKNNELKVFIILLHNKSNNEVRTHAADAACVGICFAADALKGRTCFASSNKKDLFSNIPAKRKDLLPEINKPNNKRKPKANTILNEMNEDLIENLLNKIYSIGHPFTKHKKGSNVYNEVLNLLSKYYKKYRAEVLETFILAKEYFAKKDFLYHPGKISIRQFLSYNSYERQTIPFLNKTGIESWFKEFLKGRDYIEEHYMKIKTDNHPEVTKAFGQVWMKFKKQEDLTFYERKQIINFVDKCYKYIEVNKRLNVRTIINLIEKEIMKDKSSISSINNPSFFVSNYFWQNLLPQMLIDNGIYRERREIKMI